jgi:hypothetical protein
MREAKRLENRRMDVYNGLVPLVTRPTRSVMYYTNKVRGKAHRDALRY